MPGQAGTRALRAALQACAQPSPAHLGGRHGTAQQARSLLLHRLRALLRGAGQAGGLARRGLRVAARNARRLLGRQKRGRRLLGGAGGGARGLGGAVGGGRVGLAHEAGAEARDAGGARSGSLRVRGVTTTVRGHPGRSHALAAGPSSPPSHLHRLR